MDAEMNALLEKMAQDKKKAIRGADWTKRLKEDVPSMAPTSTSKNQGGKETLPELTASPLAPQKLRRVARASINRWPFHLTF